jgi:prepilin-type N-terminal cleavage/methylation domain-containing protein
MISGANERGTSLMEVLCAMSLFAIVASGVAAMAANSMRATANNRQSTAAQMIAQEELEQLRGFDYADIESRSRSETMENQTFDVHSEVVVDNPAAGMKHITVTVSWNSPLGSRQYELETIFTSIKS